VNKKRGDVKKKPLKVKKSEFDKVLGKLIQTKPQKRKS